MALSNYTRDNLLAIVRDATADPNIGSDVVLQDAINSAARQVYLDVDLRSAKRNAVITPNIFDDVYQYTAPSDLKDYAIIDIKPQKFTNRTLNSRVKLVSPEEFDRKKRDRNLLCSVFHTNMTRVLLVNIDVDDNKETISQFNSLSDGASTNWIAFGDATNVVLDTSNSVEGGASIKFDLVGSGTTAGLENTAITSFSIGTDVVDAGVALAWIYINSTTNLTNWIIRIGSSSSNYYQITATTDHAGNSFAAGWNLIRWNFSSKSETGTVDRAAIDYCAVYMTKTSGKDDDGYRIDDLQLHAGEIYEIHYYSKFPWQRDNQTYAENSAGGTDYINADTDEIDLIAARVRMEIARRRRDAFELNLAKQEYNELLRTYKLKNPTDRLTFENDSGYAKPF